MIVPERSSKQAARRQMRSGLPSALRQLLPLLFLLLPLSLQAEAELEPLPFAEEPCYLVRHNPSACDCAAFEVRQGALWTRVYLEDASDSGLVSAWSEAVRSTSVAEHPGWAALLRVTDRVRRCPLGHPHPVVEVLGACRAPERTPATGALLPEAHRDSSAAPAELPLDPPPPAE